jgi:hypothetical protein
LLNGFDMLHECLGRKETRMYLHFDMIQGSATRNIVCSLSKNYLFDKTLAIRFTGPTILGVADDDVIDEIVTSYENTKRYFPCNFIKGILPEGTNFIRYETTDQYSMYLPNYTLEIKLNFT